MPGTHRDLDELRAALENEGLDRSDLAADPFEQFASWFVQAGDAGVHQHDAMALATVSAEGRPSVRHVLLKGVDGGGLVFYTNQESAKAADLAANPLAAVVFPWLQLNRQVRASGTVGVVGPAEADTYFASRPRGSQLGAWASRQSRVLADRVELDERVRAVEARFEGVDVERPPHWGGYRLLPDEWEFWQGRRDRLHDRFRYRLVDGDWHIDRLSP